MNRNRYQGQWEVASFTDTDKVYKVSQLFDGTYVCGCPHHIFRKVNCKHILYIMAQRDTIGHEWTPVSKEDKARRITLEDITPSEPRRKKNLVNRRISL